MASTTRQITYSTRLTHLRTRQFFRLHQACAATGARKTKSRGSAQEPRHTIGHCVMRLSQGQGGVDDRRSKAPHARY